MDDFSDGSKISWLKTLALVRGLLLREAFLCKVFLGLWRHLVVFQELPQYNLSTTLPLKLFEAPFKFSPHFWMVAVIVLLLEKNRKTASSGPRASSNLGNRHQLESQWHLPSRTQQKSSDVRDAAPELQIFCSHHCQCLHK